LKVRKKIRLDERLVKEGLFLDLKSARGWIMAGKVVVHGEVLTKPGANVKPGASLHVRGRRLKYVSRGGYKLETALKVFRFSVRDKVVLDAGASTGGFTDCLIQHGASVVYAVDVGHGQLRGKLRNDPRVINLEKTNISDLTMEQLKKDIDLCTVDLSYLSLTKGIPILSKLFKGPVIMFCLLKPLFEGLAKTKINNQASLKEVLNNCFETIKATGLGVSGVTVSPILGSKGSVEFLILVTDKKQKSSSPESLAKKALDGIASARER